MSTPAAARLVNPRFLLVTLGVFLYITSAGMQIPTLPLYVTQRLGGSELTAGIVAGGYYFSAFFVRPFIGRLGDLRGRRILLLGGSILAAVTSAALAWTSSVADVLPLRLLGGLGEAALFVAGLAAIDDISPPERRGEAIAISTLSIYLGLAVGPPFGEWLAQSFSFDVAWYGSAVVALLATAAFWPVGETKPERTEPPRFRLIHPAGILTGTVILASSLGFAGYSAFLKLYSQELGLASAGGVFALYSMTLVALRLLGRRLPDRLGAGPTARVCLILSTVGLIVMGAGRNVPALLVGTVVLAAGQSLTFPALAALTVAAAPESERANALATYSGFLDISFGLGPILVGALVAALDYDIAFYACAGFAASGYLIMATLLRSRAARVPLPQPGSDVPTPPAPA